MLGKSKDVYFIFYKLKLFLKRFFLRARSNFMKIKLKIFDCEIK